MIEVENFIPTRFAKDQRSYKFEDLQFTVETPVDFESLRVNGFPEIKRLFEKQDLMYYFDILNGHTYTELIKEFWMKASIITRESYNTNLEKLLQERPELRGKSPVEMGLRPFVGVEIESYVVGLRVSIRLEHIYEALKLSPVGLFLKTTDSVASDVTLFIYKKESESKSNTELTNLCKVIYKIFIDSIVPKLGGTDQISVVQKLFMFHVGKGNLVNVTKLIFIHLLDAIDSGKSIIHHGRLLSHMFAQCGLLDAVKPFFPGFGTYLTSSKVINSTTLRYLHLVKNNKIVHPLNPLLLKESEDGIAECRLVHVSYRDARNIAEVCSGETKELTVRQKRLMGEASRVYLKRKAAKSPSESRGKKVAKTTTGERKPRKPKISKKLLLDATEEEKEKAEIEVAVKKVADFKEKEKELKDTYDSGMDPKEFDKMYSDFPTRDDPQTLANQSIYEPVDNGKFPEYIVNGSVSSNVFQKSTYIQPPLVLVKRAYDILFINVDPKKDHQKNLTFAEMRALRENQHLSKPFKPFQTKPSESKVNTISNVAAASSSAQIIQSVHNVEDSEATPSPPPKIVTMVGQEILNLEPSPEKDQSKPQTPTP
jgi:hypothetical protein